MKTFEYTFSVGETKTLPGGRFFMIMDSTDPVDVKFLQDMQTLDESGDDIEAGYKARPVNGFDTVQITSATAQVIKVGISRGQGDYDKTVLGTIEVRDENLTDDGAEFFGGANWIAVASMYTHVQLWNPATSGVELVVHAMRVSAFGAGFILQKHNAAITTIFDYGFNKNLSTVASSQAEIRVQNNASPIGTYMNQVPSDANGTPVPFNFKNSPVIIPEGYGLSVLPDAQNNILTAQFEWTERGV